MYIEGGCLKKITLTIWIDLEREEKITETERGGGKGLRSIISFALLGEEEEKTSIILILNGKKEGVQRRQSCSLPPEGGKKKRIMSFCRAIFRGGSRVSGGRVG